MRIAPPSYACISSTSSILSYSSLAGFLSYFFLVLSCLVFFCLCDVYCFCGKTIVAVGDANVGVSTTGVDISTASMPLDNPYS